MSAVLQRASIKRLSAQLADQIAAGEVIERPASVLKELIENAIDAESTRLDIEIQQGGMERIRVTDNGIGIPCHEIMLAVSRHATSKLSTLSDLQTLSTLGFRGEALASICSVSQWQLISSVGAESACKLTYQHADQALDDHHPRGTTVQVDRLFYNTPARKKFLRAERTEYRHCDDIIRRMALSRFDVGFYVKHNGRMSHRLPVANDDISRTRRVTKLCGEAFIRDALAIDFPRDGMRLWGWISNARYSRQQNDLQYVYINGRIVRDRAINHAIRLAYQTILPTGRQAAYILHLEMDAAAFDVNVHPTKQEVRFREMRLVHDFISRSLRQALQNIPVEQSETASYQSAYSHDDTFNSMQVLAESASNYSSTQTTVHSSHTILFDRFLVCDDHNNVSIIDLQLACAHLLAQRWFQQYRNQSVTSRPLLLPPRIKLSAKQSELYSELQTTVDSLGFDISLVSEFELIIRQVPAVLDCYAPEQLIDSILNLGKQQITATDMQNLLIELAPNLQKLSNDFLQQLANIDLSGMRACKRVLGVDDLLSILK